MRSEKRNISKVGHRTWLKEVLYAFGALFHNATFSIRSTPCTEYADNRWIRQALKWAAAFKGKNQSCWRPDCHSATLPGGGSLTRRFPLDKQTERSFSAIWLVELERTQGQSYLTLGLSDWPNNASNSPAANFRDLSVPGWPPLITVNSLIRVMRHLIDLILKLLIQYKRSGIHSQRTRCTVCIHKCSHRQWGAQP